MEYIHNLVNLKAANYLLLLSIKIENVKGKLKGTKKVVERLCRGNKE